MEYDIIVPTIGNDRVKQIFRVSKGDKNMLPISDILIRSISGYVFIVPVLYCISYTLKNQEESKAFSILLLYFYSIIIFSGF